MSYPGEQIAVATTPERRAANIAVYPHGGTLTSFLDQNWAVVGNERGLLPQCLTQFNAQCEAVLLDLNGDGRDEVALLDPANSSAAITFEQGPDGTWRTIGALSGPLTCKTVLAALRDGTFSLVPPPWCEVDAGGQRLLFQSDQEPAGDPCSNP
jgi:hypothetical protein